MQVISIRYEYLKTYDCANKLSSLLLGVVSWNHIIVYKLLELVRKTKNYITVQIANKGHKTNLLYFYFWFGLVLWYINHCWFFNAKSCFYIVVAC